MRTQTENANGSQHKKLSSLKLFFNRPKDKPGNCLRPQTNNKMAKQKTASQDEAKKEVEVPKVETPVVEFPKEKIYTSEKLTELEAKRKTLKKEAAIATMADDEKTADEKLTEAWKVGEEIKKEIQALKDHERELEKKEKEAATVKLLDDVLNLHVSNLSAIGNDKLTIDEKNAINDAYHSARQIVVNRLLGSVPKVTVKGESKGTKGAAGQAVITAMESGKTYDEMIAEGHKDGTIRSIAWSEKFGKNPDGTYTRK